MNDYNYDDNLPMDMEEPVTPDNSADETAVDWAEIANAGAKAINGSNGSEFCKTIRHGIYCLFGLAVICLCLKNERS